MSDGKRPNSATGQHTDPLGHPANGQAHNTEARVNRQNRQVKDDGQCGGGAWTDTGDLKRDISNAIRNRQGK